jgi:hypothetical protein
MTILQIGVIVTPNQHSKNKRGRKTKNKKLKYRHHNDEQQRDHKKSSKKAFTSKPDEPLLYPVGKPAQESIQHRSYVTIMKQIKSINQSIEGSSTNLVDRRELRRWWSPGP